MWEVKISVNASWGWRKLLRIRDRVRPFMFSRLGNGNSTSAWFDTWANINPLNTFMSCHDIYSERFYKSSRVSKMIGQNGWLWPNFWLTKYNELLNLDVPILRNINDRLFWSMGGVDYTFWLVWFGKRLVKQIMWLRVIRLFGLLKLFRGTFLSCGLL